MHHRVLYPMLGRLRYIRLHERRMISDDDRDDILLWILRVVTAARPGVDLLPIEQAARQHWGGQRPNISKHPRQNAVSASNERPRRAK
jgi:hypothetical protein